jgi:hypothetical protein
VSEWFEGNRMIVPYQTTVPLDRFMISRMDLIRSMRYLSVFDNENSVGNINMNPRQVLKQEIRFKRGLMVEPHPTTGLLSRCVMVPMDLIRFMISLSFFNHKNVWKNTCFGPRYVSRRVIGLKEVG